MHYTDWPGKSPASPDGVAHPAVYHMLDVAAVAEILIARFAFDAPLREALVLLVALHDLGKISDSFRRMLEEGRVQPHRHWQLSEVLLHRHDGRLSGALGGTPLQRQLLYAATAGHHGRPPDLALGALPASSTSRQLRRLLQAVGSGEAPAGQVIDAFCGLWPAASLNGLGDDAARQLSWWLPGLCAAADWIGSNTRWFTAAASGAGLAEYLAQTRRIADVAVIEAGLGGGALQAGPIFDFALRPMQRACRDMPLPDGPMLAVIEDETGAGKTEAALILAHRMALAGKGRGLYFALPTMATADAMFSRTANMIGRMYRNASLTLAHGRSDLSAAFRDMVSGGARGEDEASCTVWLAESRRRALLADVGVGTIDQALLSVLPVKHQPLRHFGLSSKILVVDEVHEMGEPYVARELERLLRMHRAAGGSAIVLTATLPLDLRRMLLETYGEAPDSPAYPALSVAGGPARTTFAQDDRPRKGPVRISRLSSAEEAVELIADSAALGAACVWVRNAVDEAIAAPVLHVLSPDPDAVADERWLQPALGKGAWVYSLADVWRTARVLFAKGELRAPDGLRALIESVHGPDAEEVPDVLVAAELEITGKRMAEGTQAQAPAAPRPRMAPCADQGTGGGRSGRQHRGRAGLWRGDAPCGHRHKPHDPADRRQRKLFRDRPFRQAGRWQAASCDGRGDAGLRHDIWGGRLRRPDEAGAHRLPRCARGRADVPAHGVQCARAQSG
ncbi:CRISPR-associated endonuclease Cas3'' [Salipiger sp. 1_MG-2023]|nr:CRISPR-associated endonuclease Cas3'' [Salipiger sp. 1_MG-2023]MDO6587490.1 CRISPR-associated endonuclease Cas3'' [Salipiger sp. 1_MG-2023]